MAPCRSWSELPKELISYIAKCLDTRTDVLRFRAVCCSWRASVPLPPKSPKLPMHFSLPVNDPRKPIVSAVISQTVVYRIAQPGFHAHPNRKSCFIRVEETEQENKFRLVNPFSERLIKHMPANFPKEINHLNFRVEELTKGFSIRLLKDDGSSDLHDNNFWTRKLKLASDFDSSYKAISISSGQLRRARLDTYTADIHWCSLDTEVHYRDITNFDGKFFMVNIYGVILGMDESFYTLDEVHTSLEQKDWECERYFVESCGHLYLVVRDFLICPTLVQYNYTLDAFMTEAKDANVPVKFKVYKRIPSGDQRSRFCWVEVNDLGDRAFFVSTDCSFSFLTRDYTGCGGNCIIYVDEIDNVERLRKFEPIEADNDKEGLKQLKNGKVRLYNLADQSSAPLALFPHYLDMFWPPPTWLKWDQGPSNA
ncbi:hypothetical protein Goshw_027511 [Gossypium schwendimanii]|uniref:F-box domain-containing protein n=1 Tax=Gossypium schwendimanii TaxID=34291 RepID=A0A7J9KV18_GOSSC|nr:hypothetical protein [Gossypium schwendimanii]